MAQSNIDSILNRCGKIIMKSSNFLLPNFNDGRFFVSPILGCTGACQYCYLKLYSMNAPKKNMIDSRTLLKAAEQCTDFMFGKQGTIISVGAWGDIFPINNIELIEHSISIILFLLSWGNPVQIMSKYAVDDLNIKKICNAIQYEGQLLYSTTVTTIDMWEELEPNTSSPIDRLNTCYAFHQFGVPTNVLLKPFFKTLTGVEINKIASLLLKYHIDFCTVGIFYWDDIVAEKAEHNPLLQAVFQGNSIKSRNHLDCNGDVVLKSTDIFELHPYVEQLRELGINAYLKSSCVNSNVLHKNNPSKYYHNKNNYCIQCGNCN